MAIIIVTVILSLILLLALIDAGMGEYKIRWFPGKKRWVTWVYDHWDRPLSLTYDWETGQTTIFGPKVWKADYYSPRPGWWVVDGCPISYKFTDSMGYSRYIFRTTQTEDGLICYYYDDIYPPKNTKKESEEDESFF